MIPRKSTTCRAAAILIFAVGLFSTAHSQTETAMIRGAVTDPSGAMIPEARVRLIDVDRGTTTEGASGTHGFYTFAGVRPGHYRMEVDKAGFKLKILTAITVNVLDKIEQDFTLEIGPVSDSITVQANPINVNTSDATVSTLIDNRFVENLPLNGRSFGSLLDLTPGVVLTPSNFFEQGQFSVNGQRPDANYFTVDGVSANFGTPAGASFGQGGTGQLPATSAFGGLSNLVSLDALQEFRIQTSTFAPEFGRSPGAQVAVITKSGTNTFHGTAFEYLRNDVLDANDWFANNKDLPQPALRQNDFGGVLGGPIKKDKLFFFGSYEGLRVRQPQVANTYVPSLASRQSAPAAVQPLLNAFPKPNGADLGNGTAGFAAGYSDPSTLDSYSGRADYLLSQRLTVFGRNSDAPSSTAQRGGGSAQTTYSNILHNQNRTQTATLGVNGSITQHLLDELRFNYSRSRADTLLTLDNFGGAVPPSASLLFPSGQSLSNANYAFLGDFNPFGLIYETGKIASNVQHQQNVADNLSWIKGTHELKFGMDYRRLNPEERFSTYQQVDIFGSLASVLANSILEAAVISRTPDVEIVSSNWSLFAQDTWKLARNLTMTYGLRWEYDTAPSSPNGTPPFTVTQVTNLATTTLAPAGTPLWHPAKDNLAPRVGFAWQAYSNLVLRAGAGIFYDLGYSDITNAMIDFPYIQQNLIFGTSFPLSSSAAAPPPFKTSPPAAVMAVVDPNHVLPRTYEWNAAIEQTVSRSDVLTLTYIGAAGRKLMRRDLFIAPNSNFTGEFDVLSNHGTSNYHSLQAQYRHRLSHALQALLSYTWGHSIDDVSSDGNFQNVPLGKSLPSAERGPSDYDIRNTFSGAVSYDIPGPSSGVLKRVFGSWSTDSIFYARSAPPVNVVTGKNPFPGTVLSGANGVQRPDVVPGVPLYLHPSGVAGGKVINAAAFTVPASGQGNLGRNALRGFGATQWDFTVRRQFRMTEKVGLQFRSDFFNILNHANFGSPVNYLSSPQFGQSTQMLNNYLGGGGQSGGLNPLYQIGGPRSIQLALKLQF